MKRTLTRSNKNKKKRTNSLRKQAVTQQPEQPATTPANRIRSATEFLPRSLGSLPDPVRLLPLALPRRRAAVLPRFLPVFRCREGCGGEQVVWSTAGNVFAAWNGSADDYLVQFQSSSQRRRQESTLCMFDSAS